jgi:tight adherence protein B
VNKLIKFIGQKTEQNTGIAANSHMDYDKYTMPVRHKLIYTVLAAAAIFVIGMIFYHSVIISLILTPLSVMYPNFKIREIIIQRKSELNLQFKDMLYALSASLSAGRSIESSLKDVLRDLHVIYPDPQTYIITEVELIVKKLEMNETVEAALSDLAKRSHLQDLENFVDVLHTSKRAGGNILEVIKNTSNIISDKIEIRQEIDVILSQRKFEHKILNILPVIMILLLTVSAEDYMKPVFTELPGRIAMTFSLALLAIAYFISRRIMDIKV